MSAKHTGGTWRAAAKPSSIVGWPIISAPQGRSVANVHGTDDESAANALLIAAAPTLLEALRAADEAINPTDVKTLSMDKWNGRLKAATVQIRDAIAKATGAA